MTFAARLTLFVLICSALLMAANNPVPFVNQPLVPASVAPGGNTFQLTVNGTGFVAGSTVNWNGSPRATTFVNQGQLTATILSTDIATASTASITVTSPAPGGGASSVVFLPVRSPSSFVSLNTLTIDFAYNVEIIGVGDFNKDGIQDMAVGLYDQTTQLPTLSILLGNDDGTFTQGAEYPVLADGFMNVVDLNNDGNLDLVFESENAAEYQAVAVMFGNGDGTFGSPVSTQFGPGPNPQFGDFNQDGKLDIAYASGSYCIALGNGDGTFQQPSCTTISGQNFETVVTADFNRDGKLDLALTSDYNPKYVLDIALGKGDGTFQISQTYSVAAPLYYMVASDFNGDGNQDIAAVVNDVGGPLAVFFGNGDGSFRSGPSVPTPYDPAYIQVADMNGDGFLDFIGSAYYFPNPTGWISLANGYGTFQNYSVFDGGNESGYPALGDFNHDGRIDLAIPNFELNTITILIQDNGTVLRFTPDNLMFPTQAVGTVSPPKLITVTNNGTSAVKFSGISTTANFSQLSNCKTIQPGGSCKIGVYFTPTVSGNLPGYLVLTDNDGGNPQFIALSGVATIVELAPTSLNFGNWHVGSFSKSQDVIVTNNGNGPLQISKIAIGGADPRDFYQVNACPAKLAAGSSCTITVLFHPTATGTRSALLGVEDNGGGSPQTVALSGTGT